MADIAELGREVVRHGFAALKTNIVMPRDPAEVFFGGFDSGGGTTDQYVTTPLLHHIEELIGTFRDAVGPDVDINLDLLWLEIDMYDPDAVLPIKQSTNST